MKTLFIVIYLALGCIILPAQQAGDATTKEQEAETAKRIAIPVSDISGQADELYNLLSKIREESAPTEQISKIEEELPVFLDTLKKSLEEPSYKQLDEASLRMLQNYKQEWEIYQKKFEDWKKALVERSKVLEANKQVLEQKKSIWQETSELARREKAPRAIRSRVSEVTAAIITAEKEVATRLNTVLVLQNKNSQIQLEIAQFLNRIREAENDLQSQIFVIDSPPLWQVVRADSDTVSVSTGFTNVWSEIKRTNMAFINANEDRFYLHIILFAVIISLFVYLNIKNKKHNLIDENDSRLQASAFFVSRPLSAASLVTIMLSIWIYPDLTSSVTELLLILLIVPMVRLVPGLYIEDNRKLVYLVLFMFIADLIQRNAATFIAFQRITLLLITIVAIVGAIWYYRLKSSKVVKPGNLSHILRTTVPVLILLLFISIIGNVVGSTRLSNRLTWGIIESTYGAILFYISARVFSGLVAVLIRRRHARATHFISTYSGKIERWVHVSIVVIAFLLWGRSTLNSLGIYQGLQEWFTASMEHTWTVGSLVISVNAIADFILVIIGTFIFLRIIIALLDLEVFPRLSLPKGLPAAISMMVRYIFIAFGVLLALSAIGVDMGKFGILAGALGVGLGFGLQKIVANFISSLIIAFNRLIRVGDTVKYQDVVGNVTAVGVNASTVRKFDGAEVLIPNADLISNKVINWTLSDNQRRMELPVKVAYGSDPHLVNQLLEKVAQWHPDVLHYPESFAIFNGFQEHYLDFTLYYWIPTSAYFTAKNEIALSVYDILRLHGIDTPRPQRDITMESVPISDKTSHSDTARSGDRKSAPPSQKKTTRTK